jgi:hypothetical protein
VCVSGGNECSTFPLWQEPCLDLGPQNPDLRSAYLLQSDKLLQGKYYSIREKTCSQEFGYNRVYVQHKILLVGSNDQQIKKIKIVNDSKKKI